MATTQYRWIGDHPREFAIGVGESATYPWLGTGDFIDLDSAVISGDEELTELMDEGLLLDVEATNAAGLEAEAEAAKEEAAAKTETTSESSTDKTTATKGGKA